ncbi:hypothetical protein TrLO_g13009 [Triparma laevis f. longispina]|uniref:SAGA-associated factor 11 n=1 Tax=Triparma laevis f. longispina TaxID=1714387 RepID=A0A9W7KVB1_9STRA|nr:hypothetical protein TrLO_g13009 [Triparma laevis f. longispina]
MSNEEEVFASILSMLLLDVAHSANALPVEFPPPPAKRAQLDQNAGIRETKEILPIPEPGNGGGGDFDIYGRVTPKDPSSISYLHLSMTSSQTSMSRASPSTPLLEPQLRREGVCQNCKRKVGWSRFVVHLEKCLGNGREGSTQRSSKRNINI